MSEHRSGKFLGILFPQSWSCIVLGRKRGYFWFLHRRAVPRAKCRERRRRLQKQKSWSVRVEKEKGPHCSLRIQG